MTAAEPLILLSATATDIVRSIEAAGFDVDAYVRKYRPALF